MAVVSFRVVFTLGLLTALAPITMELYTPSLPAMAAEFGSTISQMQATISSMLVTFSLAQLVIGSLSDSMGRKPALLIGMGVYALASVSASLAGNIAQLQLQRALQGIGSAVAMVTGQALVRDLFPDTALRARITGRLASVRASCPLVAAPAVGAYLQLSLGASQCDPAALKAAARGRRRRRLRADKDRDYYPASRIRAIAARRRIACAASPWVALLDSRLSTVYRACTRRELCGGACRSAL